MNSSEECDRPNQLMQATTLAKFGELALRSDDLDEILTEACRLIGEALGTDLAKVMELQTDGITLFVRAGVGWKPGVVGVVSLKLADNTSEGVALKTGEPMISPNIEGETRFAYPDFLIDNGVRAIANVIIIGGSDKPPFGILQIDSRTPRHFSRDDTIFLSSYANLVAAAVDRLRTVAEVSEKEARLRLALDGGMLGCWYFDPMRGKVSRSRQYDEIFGLCELLQPWSFDTFLDQVLPVDREQVAQAFQDAVVIGAEWQIECRIRRANDGEIRWIEARGRSDGLKETGLLRHSLGIVADITARKDAEEAMVHHNVTLEAKVMERTRDLIAANARLKTEAEERQQAEAALRQAQKMEAIGQLSGGIAHDFNNLLQGISGSLELMHRRAMQEHAVDIVRYIEIAMGSANRAAAVAHRLLAFSCRQTLEPEIIDVNRLVTGMETLLRQTVGSHVEVEISLSVEPWLVLCDPHQLENALLNLFINARDAMPSGGKLLVETANIALLDRRGAPKSWPPQDVPPGQYIGLSVADTGVGMTPGVLSRAFDPFFTTKPTGQGTGLGLSMIYGFMQQSGGHVRLRSEVGCGTTVALYLPRHNAARTDLEKGRGTINVLEAPARAVVLLVEDEADVRVIIKELLSNLGYLVLEAETGRAGLEIVHSAIAIDLLLTDVGLPGGMNGRQLADAARERRRNLNVLFMTGYAAEAFTQNGPMEPGMHVVIKPFKLSQLASRVEAMIRTSSVDAHPTLQP